MSESNIQASPGSIFICYRREDSADVTGRIYDRLIDHFGPERVFMDVEAIRLGYDFRSEIDQTIKACSIVIVVIGDKWLADVDGKRRIDDENDRVRIEIESALRREIPIIPVLARAASHPTKAMLPASLEALAYRHGTSIRHEHFRADVDSLISQMDKLLARHESTPSKSAEPKEPTTPMKSTQTTQSQPAIPPVASVSAIAASKEPAVWTRKRLITVTAVAALVILPLLVTITVLLTRPHPSPTTPHPSVGPSAENDYAEAMKLATGVGGMRIDLPKAAEYLQRAAAKNAPEAEARLAYWVNNGVGGLAKDNVKGEQWAKKALADGLIAKATNSVEAQAALAMLYEVGLGVSKDLGKAVELYQKAADQGHAGAQNNLGLLYENGQGVAKDLGKAVELYQKAADQGHAGAQNNLGLLYENGQGVAKIELTSTPSGARIFEGDKPIGTTPFHGELPSGEATLVFMLDGYLPREFKAALAPKKLFKAEVALAKPAAIYQGTVYAPGERERPLSVKLGGDLKSGTMTYGSRRGDFVVKFTGLWNGTIMHGVTGEVVSQPAGIRWTPESFTLRFAENGVTASYECTADNKTYIANLSAR